MDPVLITGLVSLVTGAMGSIMTLIVVDRKAYHDSKLESAAQKVAHELLRDETWSLRSLAIFKSRLPGMSDDDLRRLLIKTGAISFKIDDIEVWGLLSRNRHLLNIEKLDGPLEKREVLVTVAHSPQRQQQQQQMQHQRYLQLEGGYLLNDTGALAEWGCEYAVRLVDKFVTPPHQITKIAMSDLYGRHVDSAHLLFVLTTERDFDWP
jgi:hypothetical protein